MGWTLQTKGEKINWAGFAAETNVGQRKSYARRAKMWLTWLADLVELSFAELAVIEGFAQYLDVEDPKKPVVQLFQNVMDNNSGAIDGRSTGFKTRPPSVSAAALASR